VVNAGHNVQTSVKDQPTLIRQPSTEARQPHTIYVLLRLMPDIRGSRRCREGSRRAINCQLSQG